MRLGGGNQHVPRSMCRDSFTSRAMQHGVTPFTTSVATFSNNNVDISHVTSCGVTKVLIVSQSLTRPKEPLLLKILVR